jgi:serine/threonine protein kinase
MNEDDIDFILDSFLKGVSSTNNLFLSSINGSLRDASLTTEHISSIFSILTGSQVLSSRNAPPLAAPARSVFDISIALLSYPEVLQSRELRRASSTLLLTTNVIDSILRRIVLCSEALSTQAPFALGARSQKVLPGLVTMATSSSSSSSTSSTSYFFPKSSSYAIETNKGRRGPCRGIYQCTSSFLAMKDTADASTATLSTADEMAYLKALLYFLHDLADLSVSNDGEENSADKSEIELCTFHRSLLLTRCESFLVNVGRDPSPVVSLAVEIVLGFINARLKGEYERALSSEGETFRYFQNIGSVVKSTNFATETLLHSILLPLHSMPGMSSDTSSSLSCFHETLSACIMLILSTETPTPFSSLTAVISRLVELLPSESNEQSKKIHFGSAHSLLILHGIDALLKSADTLPQKQLSPSMWLVLDKILPFCVCDSSREAQKALSFFRIQSFVNFVVTELDLSQLSRLLSAIVFRSKNWNLTVNRMSVAAAKALYSANEQRVLDAVSLHLRLPNTSPGTNSRPIPLSTSNIPVRRSHLSGVMSASESLGGWKGSSGVQPAVVTGVAPWAKQVAKANTLPPPPPPRLPTPALLQGSLAPIAQEKSEKIQIELSSTASSTNSSLIEVARKRFEEALLELSPPIMQSANSLVNPTVSAALSRSPVLLPFLSFQDLVFGHELGAGSFSSVRYTKLIRKGLPASQWPEYAVKVISTKTINEMGYELAVRREIAVLSSLTHPNVTRLASAFRWRDGAFLVLEYCSGGDLQKLLSEVGSLSEDAAKFLMAEVCAGIHHIHSKGLAYGDCKPENIVLVGTGTGSDRSESVGLHAKITDFAACRPINTHGLEIFSNARDILKNLRDGDWRAQRGLAEAAPGSPQVTQASQPPQMPQYTEISESPESEEFNDDDRLEGTLEYLAPELANRRGQPTIGSDAFAFGVTLFKVLTGELPNLEQIQASSMSHTITKVRFDDSGITNQSEPSIQSVSLSTIFPKGFPPGASALISRLLSVNPQERLLPTGDFLSILQHPWFQEERSIFGGKSPDDILNGDLTNLPAPLVQNGLRGPPPDPAWSRRHNSTMWAPLPKDYETNISSHSDRTTLTTNVGQLSLSRSSHRLLDYANAESDAIVFKKIRL